MPDKVKEIKSWIVTEPEKIVTYGRKKEEAGVYFECDAGEKCAS